MNDAVVRRIVFFNKEVQHVSSLHELSLKTDAQKIHRYYRIQNNKSSFRFCILEDCYTDSHISKLFYFFG